MDDAAGEAFDKGAAVLGLGYPGGPAIQRAAQKGDARAIQLPRPRKGTKDCHFSFSGLKTALAQKWEKTEDKSASSCANFAASLQAAIADCLIDRTRRAMQEFADETNTRQLVIAGEVAANLEIGTRLKTLAKELSFDLAIPPAYLCTDNAAMIAWQVMNIWRWTGIHPLILPRARAGHWTAMPRRRPVAVYASKGR